MKYVHAYAWMFATLLFVWAVQTLPGTLTGNATLIAGSASPSSGSMQAMGLFIILVLAVSIGYARYRHFAHSYQHPE
jgi:hypothetical protein